MYHFPKGTAKYKATYLYRVGLQGNEQVHVFFLNNYFSIGTMPGYRILLYLWSNLTLN